MINIWFTQTLRFIKKDIPFPSTFYGQITHRHVASGGGALFLATTSLIKKKMNHHGVPLPTFLGVLYEKIKIPYLSACHALWIVVGQVSFYRCAIFVLI